MTQTDAVLNLIEVLAQLDEALRWLNRSYRQCQSIGLKPKYSENEYDLFESLISRFARVADILTRKLYRSIDVVELEFGGTMIDVANRAEKRGLIDTIDELRAIKDLRNNIAHEYISEHLVEIFHDTLQLTPKLVELVERAKKYCQKYPARSAEA
jgi:uncharacterized protein YutE (UPF0331/DUF86 family)